MRKDSIADRRRSAIQQVLVILVGILAVAALSPGQAVAAAKTPSPAGEDRAQLVSGALVLDCVNMTQSARKYATENQLCTADGKAVAKRSGALDEVTGNCGSSWIFIYNANRGNARFVYGYHSTQGTVIAHVLRVSWYNWATSGANGWTDAAGRLSATYDTSATRFTGAGYVAAGSSGFVTLWWGGTCTLLNPTDAVTVRP